MSADIDFTPKSDLEEELEKIDRLTIRMLNKYKQLYTLFNKNFFELGFDLGKPTYVDELNHYVKIFSTNLVDFLKNKDIHRYVFHKTHGSTLQNRLSIIVNNFIAYNSKPEHYLRDNIENTILNYTIDLNDFLEWYTSYFEQISIKLETDNIIHELRANLSKTKITLEAINGSKTENIYSDASDSFLDSARVYEFLFYLLILATVLITVISLIYFPYSDLNKVNFIFSKVITFSLVITLGTLFVRKASHLRKLHEQANQTSLELQALPLYLNNIKDSEHSDIYKSLIDKYFGKELDQTQNDKIGDLMKDQLAAGTELIKASAEFMKNSKSLEKNNN